MGDKFTGTGRGSNRAEAVDDAFDKAWQKAKHAGKAGKPLKVTGLWVRGDNPLNWSRVILEDLGPPPDDPDA